MRQPKHLSLLEAKANAIVGLIISYTFTMYGLPLFGIQMTAPTAGAITAIFFFLSVARSYIIRRIFNAYSGTGMRNFTPTGRGGPKQ